MKLQHVPGCQCALCFDGSSQRPVDYEKGTTKGQVAPSGRKVLIKAPRNEPQDVLDEIYEVLLRRGYIMRIGRNIGDGEPTIVLGQIVEDGKARAVAEVKEITPDAVLWRKIEGVAFKVPTERPQ